MASGTSESRVQERGLRELQGHLQGRPAQEVLRVRPPSQDQRHQDPGLHQGVLSHRQKVRGVRQRYTNTKIRLPIPEGLCNTTVFFESQGHRTGWIRISVLDPGNGPLTFVFGTRKKASKESFVQLSILELSPSSELFPFSKH